MKLLTFAIIISLSLGFSSCSSNEKSTDPQTDNPQVQNDKPRKSEPRGSIVRGKSGKEEDTSHMDVTRTHTDSLANSGDKLMAAEERMGLAMVTRSQADAIAAAKYFKAAGQPERVEEAIMLLIEFGETEFKNPELVQLLGEEKISELRDMSSHMHGQQGGHPVPEGQPGHPGQP